MTHFLRPIRIAVAFASVLVMALLTSCATVGRQFDLRSADQLVVGATTMEEARALLGSPEEVHDAASWRSDRMRFGYEACTSVWLYEYARGVIASGTADEKFLIVYFDHGGKVEDYYYASDFKGDETPKRWTHDFDIRLVRETFVRGKTTQAEVLDLLGDQYRRILIRKEGVKERWHYMYASHPEETGQTAYGKSLDIDFDPNALVVDIRGESSFPADRLP